VPDDFAKGQLSCGFLTQIGILLLQLAAQPFNLFEGLLAFLDFLPEPAIGAFELCRMFTDPLLQLGIQELERCLGLLEFRILHQFPMAMPSYRAPPEGGNHLDR
jgi:hypothetical protein